MIKFKMAFVLFVGCVHCLAQNTYTEIKNSSQQFEIIDTLNYFQPFVLLIRNLETKKEFLKYENDTLEIVSDIEIENIPFFHRFRHLNKPIFVKSISALKFLYLNLLSENYYFPYKVNPEWVEKIKKCDSNNVPSELILNPFQIKLYNQEMVEIQSISVIKKNLDNDSDLELIVYITYNYFQKIGILYFIDKYKDDWFIIDRIQQYIDDETIDHTPRTSLNNEIVIMPSSGHGSSMQNVLYALLRIKDQNVYECIDIVKSEFWVEPEDYPNAKSVDSEIEILNNDTINVVYSFSFFGLQDVPNTNKGINHPYILKNRKSTVQFVFDKQNMSYTNQIQAQLKISSNIGFYYNTEDFFEAYKNEIDSIKKFGTFEQRELLIKAKY